MKIDFYLLKDYRVNENVYNLNTFFDIDLNFEKIFFIHNDVEVNTKSEFEYTIYLEKNTKLKFENLFYIYQSIVLTNFVNKSEFSIFNFEFTNFSEIRKINLNYIDNPENIIVTESFIFGKTNSLKKCLKKTTEMFWDQDYIPNQKKYIQYIFKSSGYNLIEI